MDSKKVQTENLPIKFEVKKIRFRNDDNGYTVAEVNLIDYEHEYLPTNEVLVVGNFVSIFEDDEFEAIGTWTNHKYYGYQIKVFSPKRMVPQTRKNIEAFLLKFVKGLGRKTVKNIVDTFGEETIAKIEENWENLLQVKGIGKKKAQMIHEKIYRLRKYEDVAMFILNHGGGYRTAIRAYEAFGDMAISKIRENPFILTQLKNTSFLLADKFAFQLKIPFNYIERVKAGILYYLEYCSETRGDLFVTEKEIKQTLPSFLQKYGAYKDKEHLEKYQISVEEIQEAVYQLAMVEDIRIETSKRGEKCIYLSKYHYMENRIVSILKKIIENPKQKLCSMEEIKDFLDKYQKEQSFVLDEKQKEAVYMALNNGISILTGGPGTGKTQTINAIIKCVQFINPQAVIELCAPTGRASKRMSELTGMEASTVHRKIGLNGFEKEQQIKEIEANLLIIDEVSMLDAYVSSKLLSSVKENTRILLVGDYEQLPSVGAGLILRDLINSKRIPTTRLTTIFRQAQDSQIVMNSHKVIEGKKTTDQDGISFDESKGDFYFIHRKNPLAIQKTILASVQQLMGKYHYTIDDIQILSPMKKGYLGVLRLNQLLQNVFNPKSEKKFERRICDRFILREGDKVIQTENDYDLEVFNGEIGKVLSIKRDEDGFFEYVVQFDDKIVVYDDLSVEELELAYAISVHKSQGSEYPVVIMPFDPSQEFMLNRNLIYTAWTRAKEMVINIGSEESLNKGIEKIDQMVRNSLIKEKLQDEIELMSA